METLLAFLYRKLPDLNFEGVRWSAEGIAQADVVSVAHLLVELAHEFGYPQRLPGDLSIHIVYRFRKPHGVEETKTLKHILTLDESDYPRLGTLSAPADPDQSSR